MIETSTELGVCQKIATDLDLLAWLHDRELDAATLTALQSASPEDWFVLPLSDEQASAGFMLLSDACRMFREFSQQVVLDELAADYAALYLTHAHRASPNESVWLTDDGLMHQEPMFAVRKWYRRYDLVVTDWRVRSDDHLVNQIVFLAELLRLGTLNALKDVGRFLDQHLMNWIESFTDSAMKNVQTPFYAGLVLITQSYIQLLRHTLEEVTGETRQTLDEIAPTPVEIEPQSIAYMPGIKPSW